MENIEYTECFLVYLDILGIKKLVSEFDNKQELIKNLINVLKINTKFVNSNQKMTTAGNINIRSWYFSDSFVFLMKDQPENLSHLFLIVRYLQDRLFGEGYLLRGAIVKEKMYYPEDDENVLLGQGMIDAYKLESEIAIYPRVVISEKLLNYIKKEDIKAYPFGKDSIISLKELIKKDYDGIYFLDLLNENILRKKNEKIKNEGKRFSIFWENSDDSNYNNIIEKVRHIIIDYSDKSIKIKQKYDWLNSYLEQNDNRINQTLEETK